MAYDAGVAALSVVPSFLNIESLLAKGARAIAKGLDKELGNQLGSAMANAAEKAEKSSERAGKKLGQVFAERALKQVEVALANIPDSDRVLKPLRKELVALSQVDLGKFDEKDFIRRVEAAYKALRRAQQDAQGPNAVGRFTNAGNAAAALGSVQELVRMARQRGFEAGDAFNDAYQRRLRGMRAALPDLRVNAQSTGDERRAAALRQRIESAQRLNVGDLVTEDNNPLNLKIGARISAADLQREMSTIEALLDQFSEQSGQVELTLAADKARAQAGAFFDDIKTAGQRAAEELAREQERIDEQNRKLRLAQTRRELDERARELKAARERELRDEQRAAEELAAWRLRSARDELAERERLAERNRAAALQALRREMDDRARLLRVERERLRRDELEAHKENARRAAEQLRNTSAGRAQLGVRQAAGAIQRIPVGLQLEPAEKDLAEILRQLDKLGTRTIGINITTNDFAREIEAEFRRLQQIAKDKKARIDVRTDAAKAASELGAVLVMLNRIDSKKATVSIDSSGAVRGLLDMASSLELNLGRLGALIAVGASLGTALVPAAAAVASAIGAIGTAALAAGSGIGVLILGFSGIGEAVKQMGNLADDQEKSNASLSRAANQVASAQDQVRSAEMALANTRRNNALAALRAQRAITEALQDQRDTVRDVQRDNADAVQAYRDAQRDAARADVEAQRAQVALADAYREAERAIADLNSAVRGNALDQRQAALDIAEARERLDKVLVNPRATQAEREQADITYQQRLLQMEDLKRKGAELSDEQERRLAQGVKGSREVRRAEEALADANERSLAARRELLRAEQDVALTRERGQRRILAAQQKVADAQRAAADQQADAAYSLFTATQSVVSAHRSLENAATRAGVAGGEALDSLNTAMGKLSPTAQAFARYLFGLREAFYALRRAADPMIAGVQRAMESLLGSTSDEAIVRLQPLMDFIGRVATALGESFGKFAEMLQSPAFQRFFAYIDRTAVPTLELLYQVTENLLVGFANLFLGFAPLTDDVNKGFLGLTERFREWSEGLDKNKGFQDFIGYLRQVGPEVMEFLGQFIKTLGKIVVAAAPMGEVVVRVFGKLFELINRIPREQLTFLVTGIAAAAGAIALFGLVTSVASLSVAGLVAGLVGLAVIAIGILISRSERLREGLKTAFEAIGAAAVWLWRNAIKPAFDGIATVVRFVFTKIITPIVQGFQTRFAVLAEQVRAIIARMRPGFEAIGAALKVAYERGIRPVLNAAGRLFRWVYNTLIKPVLDVWNSDIDEVRSQHQAFYDKIAPIFRAIGAAASWVWNTLLKPAYEGIREGFRIVAAVLKEVWEGVLRPIFVAFRNTAMELYSKYLGPAFRLIAGVVTWVWNTIIKPILGFWWTAFKFLGGVIMTVVKAVIKPAWQIIVVALKVAWAVIKVIFGLIMIAVKAAGALFVWLYRNVARPVFNAIGSVISWLWRNTIKPTFDLIKLGVRLVGEVFSTLYHKYIRPVIDNYIKPAIKRLKDLIGPPLKAAFEKAVKIVGGIWKGLVESVKAPIRIVVNAVLNNGLLRAYNWLAKKFHVKPDDVRIDLPKGFATGGRIDGPGTTTSDSVLIRASRDEHMWTAREVRAAGGHDAIYAMRRAVLRGWRPDGYARGGAIRRRPGTGDGFGDWLKKTARSAASRASDVFESVAGFMKDPLRSITELAREFIDKIPGKDTYIGKILQAIPEQIVDGIKDVFGFLRGGGEDGAQPGLVGRNNALGGSGGMMRILRAVFPGLALHSGYRPGAVTVGGNRSLHADNRAVDVSPRMDVFEWIRANYPNSYELIFSPAGGRQLYRGRDHFYSEGVRKIHWDHVHWGYDEGGLLPDTRRMPGGVMQVFHGRRTPDKVLTDNQWRNMATLAAKAKESMRGGDTYNFPYRNSTLDKDELDRFFARRDALARTGRPNY